MTDNSTCYSVYLMTFPGTGDLILRVRWSTDLRWGLPGHGKSGGLRVIYYWMTRRERILFLTVYRKTEAADLSKKAIKEMRRLVKSFD